MLPLLLYYDYTRTYSHFSYYNMTSTAVSLRAPPLPLTVLLPSTAAVVGGYGA